VCNIKPTAMKIEEIEIKFEKQNLVFEKTITKLENNKKEILFPVSNQILRSLASNMSLIFRSIIENGKYCNLYPSMILYRSLIEHFLKANYIFEKTIYTQSDEVAEAFQKYYLISEFLAEKAGVLEMEDLQKGNINKTDFLKFLVTNFPDFEGFDKDNQREISAAIKQFSLKEMIKHSYNLHKDKANSNVISNMIPEYSKVSTFTHGGMYANFLMEKFSEKNLTKNELERICEISMISVLTIKESIIMTYIPDEETRIYFQNLIKFRQ
jgi:hypothetical protein